MNNVVMGVWGVMNWDYYEMLVGGIGVSVRGFGFFVV